MTRVCPHCNVSSHFTTMWSDNWDEFSDPDEQLMRFCEVCDNCNKPICGIYAAADDRPLVWPSVVTRKSYPDMPEAIAVAASEAHQALGADAPRASVAMARATVEATAKERGISKGNLESKIDQLAKDGHISEAMRLAAHEIRFAGNEVAHGDLVDEPITVDDAAEIVDLMDAILERVYQEPAKVGRVRASREARQKREVQGEAAG
jgi:Domain of unknown function (DUF4145)